MVTNTSANTYMWPGSTDNENCITCSDQEESQ